MIVVIACRTHDGTGGFSRRSGDEGEFSKACRATTKGQWVLRTPLHIRTLVFSAQHGFKNPGFVPRPPFPLCHCLVGRCLRMD